MRTLPKPAGPHLVGTIATELIDAERARHVASAEFGRRVLIKLWYPANRSAGDYPKERLWKHLASHGFVLASVQHLDQLAELRSLQASQTKEAKEEQAKIEQRIKSSARDKRPMLWKQYFRVASNTNRIVAGRSADIQHTVSELATVLKAIPGIDVAAARIVGAIGLSLGGAVATEFSKSSASAVGFVVNLDGGNYGELQGQPVRTPYLMLYSEENEGVNDDALHVASGLEVSRYALRETKHLNLHDISMLYPILRWLRAVGPANSAFAIRRRNEIVSEFISSAAA